MAKAKPDQAITLSQFIRAFADILDAEGDVPVYLLGDSGDPYPMTASQLELCMGLGEDDDGKKRVVIG